MEQVKCVTGAASANSVSGVSQPGNPGLTWKLKNGWGWGYRTDTDTPVNETKLLTAFEHRKNIMYKQSGTSTGWFKAPATGRYRFMISCNDACQLFLNNTTPWDRSNPQEVELTEQCIRHYATEWRNYFLPNVEGSTTVHQSNWTDLTAGEYYKIEGYHMEYSGDDHFTAAVEFEKTDSTGHHHASKEVQLMSIDPTNNFEIFNITVENA
jgi:hypothetical protein